MSRVLESLEDTRASTVGYIELPGRVYVDIMGKYLLDLVTEWLNIICCAKGQLEDMNHGGLLVQKHCQGGRVLQCALLISASSFFVVLAEDILEGRSVARGLSILTSIM